MLVDRVLFVCLFAVLLVVGSASADDKAVQIGTAEENEKAKAVWKQTIARLSAGLKDNDSAGVIPRLSERGDCHFFLGDFQAAVADYTRTIELDPRLEAGHWRRGIALYYAGDYAAGASQFDAYHTVDQIDRENGIWRFLCQTRQLGLAAAGEKLLIYKRDDRPPFPQVYRLFAGDVSAAEMLVEIGRAQPVAVTPEKLKDGPGFYANLYAGLYEAVCDRNDEAVPYLDTAVANRWPLKAGYGPAFMWQTARVQRDLLKDPLVKRPGGASGAP